MSFKIERVENGWMATQNADMWVFQDEDGEVEERLSESESLGRTLEFLFSDFLQSKENGGIVLGHTSESLEVNEES